MKSIECPKCGNIINLKELFKDVLQVAIKEKTESMNKEINSLTKLLKQYMEEATNAKASMVEMQNKVSLAKKEASIEASLQLNKKITKIKEELYLENELKVKEKINTIKQLQKQLAIAQQKAEQGSMQIQGEVQELVIEEYLKKEFPLDTITEIKKGTHGADVLQVINTRTKIKVGKIYYESKRTKTFNFKWIDKLKKDMISNGSDVGVLVTSVYPTNIKKASIINGIWICSLLEFKLISKVLRDSLIKINEITYFNKNNKEKKNLIYKYIISNEFKLQIETIINGFIKLQEDLLAEKRAMQSIWHKREAHINSVIDCTIGIYSNIKGLDNNVKNIKGLDLYEGS